MPTVQKRRIADVYTREIKSMVHIYLNQKVVYELKSVHATLPIYNDQIDPQMLRKCLHKMPCFHGMIWERIPKIHYVGSDKLALGVYDAIASS